MLKRELEKPTIPQILLQQLQEMLPIKPYNSKIMALRAVKTTVRAYPVMDRR